jgi:thiol-disulfide isomerase/thioredoxin
MNLTLVKKSLIALLPMVGMTAAAADYYSNGFSSIPAAFKVLDKDGTTLSEYYYKNLDLTKAWTVGNVGRHGYAALSMSHTGDGTAQDNWLISPKVQVTSAQAFVTWEARSLHPECLESYSVMVAVDDSDEFTTLFQTNAESQVWTSHTRSLADYVGHDVRIAFVCQSADKFILAVDNLEIGVPKENKFYAVNRTPHFIGEGESAEIAASITNVGKAIEHGSVLVYVGENQEGTIALTAPLNTGETVDISYTLATALNSATEYDVRVKDEDSGDIINVLSDKVMHSYFKRKVLVDKATATWCNNCPEGDVIQQHLEETYGDEIVNINTHTGDIMVQGDYFGNLGFYNIPSFKINRNSSTTSSTNAYFSTEIEAATPVGLSGQLSVSDDRKTATVAVQVGFAEDWDNADDTYRIGYTFTRDYSVAADDPNSGKYVQSNSTLTAASGEQYYFMPVSIMPDIYTYRNVTVDCTAAFSGVAKSLPSEIHAGDTFNGSFTAAIPSKIDDLTNGRIVFYVMNTATGYVYNCEAIALSDANASVGNIIADNSSLSVKMNGRNCTVTGAEGTVNISAYSVDGSLLYSANAQPEATVTLNLPQGVSIIKVTDRQGRTATAKSILR